MSQRPRPTQSPLVDPRWSLARQVLLVVGAVVSYFGVRGLTEGAVEAANRNAGRVRDLERAVGLAFEETVQDAAAWSGVLVTLGNWVYIWCHWPLIIGTLGWFAWSRRGDYFELRNAIFISGAIGLVIFALFPVAPPRLFSPEYVDTVTQQSSSYRVLQPPAFTNKYAAVPSFHFGWNLLVGIAWFRAWRDRWWRWVGVVMPAAMAWAVVVTANHWVVVVAAGGAIALVGLAAARWWRTAVVLPGSRRRHGGEGAPPQPPQIEVRVPHGPSVGSSAQRARDQPWRRTA
jgi:hypothetical protein